MTYGFNYQGSKNAIAKRIVDALPPAENFVDLFAGGCAVTHAAILSGKYKHFYINDLSDAPSLFLRAIRGEFDGEKRFISRNDFDRLKAKDPFVRYSWSFCGNGKNYMYGRYLEPIKEAIHRAVVFGDNSRLAEMGINVPAGLDPRKFISNDIYIYIYITLRINLITAFLRASSKASKIINHYRRFGICLC
jgi:hypothetical protein